MAVLLPPNAFYWLKISHTCICGQGSALDPDGEVYGAPPDPLAACGGTGIEEERE